VAAQLAEHIGNEPLSEREIQVLEKIAIGKKNGEIGALLFITEETVKNHVKHILEKLGASDRTEAVTIGFRRGIIHL
jgi:DNA-binding NarL/FixJ family response regulator